MLATPTTVGVLFELSISYGHDVDLISAQKGEKEILLMPGAQFTVTEAPQLDGNIWVVKMTQKSSGTATVPGASSPVKLNQVPADSSVQQVVPGRPSWVPNKPPPTRPKSQPGDIAKGDQPLPTSTDISMPTQIPTLPALPTTAPSWQPARANKSLDQQPAAATDPETVLKAEADAAAKALIARASKAEPPVTSALSAIAKSNKAKMEGLNHRLKTESSLARKLADRARTRVQGGDFAAAVRIEAAKMNDVLRYTLVISKKTYKKVDDDVRATMASAGHQLKDYWNAWEAKDSLVYNGINMTFQSKDGQLFEVQLHTKDSFKTKESIHDLYEEWRAASTSSSRKQELTQEMKKKWKKVPTPSGIKSVDKS